MKQYFIEIVRQKWRFLGVVLALVLLNAALALVVSFHQLPQLADSKAKWSSLRSQTARVGHVDASALHRQGAADLEKLKERIPEKREFARVLSDLLEAASSSAVEIGTISYKPALIKDEQLFSYKLTLSVSGGYAAVKSYLSDLQRNPELIVVDSVAFSSDDPYADKVAMNLNITIYLREEA